MEKVIIIGSGPAGMTAGIYLARSGHRPLVLEGLEAGGQLMQTNNVDNYPGFEKTATGPEIIRSIRAQADRLGVRFALDEVESVDFTGKIKKLRTMMGDTYEADCVIVASGAGVTRTGLPGEAKYWGRGVSACLTCDAAFYKGRRVAVIGDGNAAKAAANYLSHVGAEVAATVGQDEMISFEGGGGKLKAVRTRDGDIEVAGAFLVTKRSPHTSFLKGALELDRDGYVVVCDGRTSVDGVFAAGDCAERNHKQAIIAAGSGAIAALEAQKYLKLTTRGVL